MPVLVLAVAAILSLAQFARAQGTIFLVVIDPGVGSARRGIAADTAGLVAKLKNARGQSLVVGHSNTIPDVLKALGAEGSFGIADDEYDNLFVWSGGDKSQLIRLRLPVPATAPLPSR